MKENILFIEDEENLNARKRKRNSTSTKIQCNLCPKELKNIQTLKSHKRVVHTGTVTPAIKKKRIQDSARKKEKSFVIPNYLKNYEMSCQLCDQTFTRQT